MSSPTYYEILGISQAMLSGHENPANILKRAYHRALLQNHPDKTTTKPPPPPSPFPSSSSSLPSPHTSTPSSSSSSSYSPPTRFTIDQISTAYKHLSTPALKTAYDMALRTMRTSSPSSGRLARRGSFQTAETVDLDDLAFDDAADKWFRGCRCGNDRGFIFGEQDLEDAGDLGELLVGCQDCSLWLKVFFTMVDDDEDD